MPALSKKQQKFMGIVRSIQKGEQPASEFSKDAQDAAKDMKKSSVKKFAKTKHKGLPTKVKKEDILNKLKETIREELKDYTYGSGDIVKDVNPSCPHHGAMGKVKSVNPRSVVFVVMNKGKNFKPGMELEKSHDQMKKMNESFTPYRDVGKKTQIASGIVSHWTRILFNELPVKHRNVNGVKKALRVIQQMYMITDHSGVTGMYRVGKRKFMKDVVSKMDKLKESVNENLRPSDKKILMVIATELVKTQMKGKNKNQIRKELPNILSTMGTNKFSKKSPTNRFNKNKMISLGKGFDKLSDSDKKVFINTLMLNAGLAESVNEAKEPEVITQLRDIVKRKQFKNIKDPKTKKTIRVDMFTANAITQVYDAIKKNSSHRNKFESLPLGKMASLSFKMMK